MKIPSFAPIYLAFKAKGSSFILFWGHGWSFILSLIFTGLLGIITVWMYEVPLHTTEINIVPLHERLGEEYFTELYFYYDYGLGVHEKIDSSWSESYFNMRITALKDSNFKSRGFRYNDNIKYAEHNYINIIKSKWVENGNSGNEISYESICPMFFVYGKNSIPPRSYFRYFHPSDVYIRPTDKFVNDSNKNVVTYYISDSMQKDTVWSINYYAPSKAKNSLNGGSVESFQYCGINSRGNSAKFGIPGLTNTYKPSWYTLYDISQGYFLYRLKFPTTKRHRSEIVLDYGGATDILEVSPQPDSTTVTSIIYYNSEKIKNIQQKGLFLYAQFKQYENIQILRMFIMTTLWGFFVALTFSSLGKFLRTRSRHFKIKHKELYERS